MLRGLRAALRPLPRRLSSMAQPATPMEDALRAKITEALKPTTLEIHNDSHRHAHHKAMQGSTSRETHFRVAITSPAFEKKMQPARHRMVYALMRDELAAEGGIHALQLRTRTPAEEEQQQRRQRQARDKEEAKARPAEKAEAAAGAEGAG